MDKFTPLSNFEINNFNVLLKNEINMINNKNNILIGLAAPILNSVLVLKSTIDYQSNDNLFLEIKNKLENLKEKHPDYRHGAKAWSIYHFMLCAFIDEIFLKMVRINKNLLKKNFMLNSFYSNSTLDKNLFSIIENMAIEPYRHRELLEFMHLCIKMGYKGKFHQPVVTTEKLNTAARTINSILIELKNNNYKPIIYFPDKIIKDEILPKLTLTGKIALILAAGSILLVAYGLIKFVVIIFFK